MICITKFKSALDRWSLSFTLRTKVVQSTHHLFRLTLEKSVQYKEGNNSCMLRDANDEDSLIHHLTEYDFLSLQFMFCRTWQPRTKLYKAIDVVFHRYYQESVKCITLIPKVKFIVSHSRTSS